MEDAKMKEFVELDSDTNEHKLSIGDAVIDKEISEPSPAGNNCEEVQRNLPNVEVSSLVKDKEPNSNLSEQNYTCDNVYDEHVEESNVEQKDVLCEKDEQVKDNDEKLQNEAISDKSQVDRNEDVGEELQNNDIPVHIPFDAEEDATKEEVAKEKEELDESKPPEQWYVDEGEETDDSRYSEEGDYTDDGEQNSQERLQANRRRRRREENYQLSGEEDQDVEYEDVEELSGEENQGATDEEHVEGKRFSGDGQEEPKIDKNADDDRKNPAYVPRKGAYFEHDLRALAEDETEDHEAMEKVKNKKKSRADDGKWKHDKFDASEQAPKKTHEIVRRYGYDIRRAGYLRESREDREEARQNGENKKNRNTSEVPRRYHRRQVHRLRTDADNSRSESPSNLPQKQINLHMNEDHKDFQINKNRPREVKKNQPHVRGYRTEIITTRGGKTEDKDVILERESETQNWPSRSAEETKAKSRGRENKGNQREVESRSNEEFCDNRTRKFMTSQKPPREEVEFEPDRERDNVRRHYERKGYSHQRNQHQPVRQPRESLGQRPPRMAKQYVDKPPRELEIVNSNVRGRIQCKIAEDEESKSSKRVVEDKRTNDRSNDSVSGGKDDNQKAATILTSSTVSTKSSNQTPEVLEARKGWAGGEFTPSWRTDPQQRQSSGQEEETNVTKGSKRYSSSRQQLQQQQKHQQFRDMDYYQQYPQYGANTGGTTGQVYDAMIPHPAYVPHSALVTNSYAPFYSTLPGNVYPSPPVYQHPQLTPYTNTSYVHHVTQAAEGPVFFSPQGLAQGQFYEAPQSGMPHMRATSAIPIVNPQDLAAVQNNGAQPETVAIHSQ